MASKLLISSLTILVIISPSLLSSVSSLDVPPANPISSGTVCQSTPYPSFCKSMLPMNNSANVYDYGRFSVRKSLKSATKFLSLIEKHLSRPQTLTNGPIQALKDCQFLAGLNMDFLLSSSRTVDTTATILPNLKADDVQTLLSAILTNTKTCLEGLQATASAWSVKNGLSMPLANDTKLYSVSLALFTKGWVPKKKKGAWKPTTKQSAVTNGRFSFKMSSRNQALFESMIRKRKLLHTNDDQVVVSDIVIVSQDGSENFTTINDAVAAAPNNTDGTNGYFLIYITAGVYEEYVSIAKNKKYLMLIGVGINQTVITGNHSVVDGWTTFSSATFAVVAQGFVAVDITFRNTAGGIKHQAVAVRNGADLSTFYRCSFEGYQVTLYVHSLRQFYRECDVYGTVDYIFGNGAVVLQNCNLYPRLPLSGQFNTITAQGRTDPNQNTGISIQNCTIKAAYDLASSNSTVQTYLGRPRKEYSRTVYLQSFMDSLINPLGWHEWDGDFALNTLYYAEYNNTGPGSNTSGRVSWSGFHIITNATEAATFTVTNFLLGGDWLPQTGVPYSTGGYDEQRHIVLKFFPLFLILVIVS